MNAEASTAQNWFVIDAPVSDVEKDAFGHDDIADNLHRMVTEPGSDAGTGDCSGQAARASSSFMMVSNSTGVNRPRRTCRRRRW
ncbi:Uncharacterised protein [Mycobacterium tuberculosis]|nr:Uncharacterised protein [Mycobacterium tuberculosis]